MPDPIRSFEDILAWRRAMELAELVYRASGMLPRNERAGLISQLRRAAVSIPSNIAEGWGRGRSKDCARMLIIARGSLYELMTQARLCRRLGFPGDWSEILEKADDVGRTLHGFIRSCPGR